VDEGRSLFKGRTFASTLLQRLVEPWFTFSFSYPRALENFNSALDVASTKKIRGLGTLENFNGDLDSTSDLTQPATPL
jgi:hypothetical protein